MLNGLTSFCSYDNAVVVWCELFHLTSKRIAFLIYLSIYLSIYLFICLQTYFRRYFSIKQDNNKKYFEEEAEDVHIVAGIMGETVTNQYPISSYTTMEQLHIMIQHTLETF